MTISQCTGGRELRWHPQHSRLEPPMGLAIARNVRSSLAEGIAGEVAVEQTPDAQGIGVLQLLRQGVLGEALKADGADEAQNGERTHGGGAAVGSGGIRAAVDHGVADFDSGRESIEDYAADLGF